MRTSAAFSLFASVTGLLFACTSDALDGAPVTTGLDIRPSNTTCVPRDVSEARDSVRFYRAFPSLVTSAPMFLAQAPGDGVHFYVAERAGRLRRFTGEGADASVVLDFSSAVSTTGEGGLLGFAFHPNFSANGLAFFSYTRAGGPGGLQSVIAKRKSADGGKSFGTEEVLLSFDQPASNHNGGNIAFGKEGFLYIGFGDGGGGGDTYKHGQDTTTFFSKILRIDVDSQVPYAIPADNPFKAGGSPPEVYARGFRNPWRFSFDRTSGDLWVGDVGQGAWEEIDRVVPGGNYGWPIREGKHCYGADTCDANGLVDPVLDLPRSEATSITGGYVYRGSTVTEMVGKYIFGDFSSGRIWSFDPANPGGYAPVSASNGNWSSFAEDAQGELYALDLTGGEIHKLIHEKTTVLSASMPEKLSETGCVDRANPRAPASGVIPYEINVPFWSDGAEKARFFAIPDGTSIDVKADGDFDLPIGSVTIKNFTVAGKRIETRLFVRHASGDWAGYSYEWNDAETDAILLTGGKTRDLGTQEWIYPSPGECLSCHGAAPGRTLGLEALQLRRNVRYPGGESATEQIAALVKARILSSEPTMKDALPPIHGSADVEPRARAYLHANCSQCHRPGGHGLGGLDMRFQTPLAETNLCGTEPTLGSFNFARPKIIAPRDPGSSVLLHRIRLRGDAQMPPLGSNVADRDGSQLIEDWVNSLVSCPAPVAATPP